jgi:hypothetical protein
MRIEVPADDFVRTHKALVRLLQVIEQSGSKGIATRQLCEQEFNSRNCDEYLEFAEKQGYITRTKEPVAKGRKGNTRNINRITSQGKRLLRELKI